MAFLLLVALLELVHLQPAGDGWRELQPLAVTYGAAVLLAAGVGVGLVIGSLSLGLALVGVAWSCVCIASVVKRRYLGAPLYPWDLLRIREVLGIWDDLPGTMRVALVVAALVLGAVVVAAAVRALRPRPDLRTRLRQAIVGMLVLVAVALPFHPAVRAWFPGPGNALSVALRLRNVRWWPEKNYQVNGFTAGFLMSLDTLEIPRPPAAAWTLPAGCDATPALPPAVDPAVVRPDVIVLLLESFFDPLVLGIPFNRDPIPFLRTMMERSGGAELHSTVWAHGTANAEFEILTGLSTAFLPPDSVVFFHYLHGPLLSLATELRGAGYRAEAVHPNAGWFYARADAYRWLGFDRAWFQPDFVPRRETRARISDDRLFFAKLRERLTPRGGPAVPPEFLWGVTLGTHGPYARDRVGRCDLRIGARAAGNGTVRDAPASEDLESLYIYSCLLERLDSHMREFVAWLDARGKPYVLFAYGDHWPPLGPSLEPHHERIDPSGQRVSAAASPAGETLRFAATPLVVASNAGVPLPLGYRGGFNFLGPAILRAAGIVPRCQFELLEPLHARVDLVQPGLLGAGTAPDVARDVNRYWALTYDLLFANHRGPSSP